MAVMLYHLENACIVKEMLGYLKCVVLVCVTLGQGGQGPGWHKIKQTCPQLGLSGFLQTSPHEWGRIHGSKVGFSTLPQ